MSPHEKRIIVSEKAPKPVGPYSVGRVRSFSRLGKLV
jgi:hypothetical protein